MRHLVFVLLAATASAGQVVEIDGEQFVVGEKATTTEAVTVKVVPYSAQVGDDARGIVTGTIVSHLPTRHIRVNLEITFWSLDGRGSVTPEPRFVVRTSIDNPTPKKATKFKAGTESGIYLARKGWTYVHSVSVTLEKLPARVGQP
jgi:hypothetical protein